MSDERTSARSIPAEACRMQVGEFALGDNGEDAKTAPVRLVARSGKPIEHWFWGRVVHDLAGMQMHKSRLTIDYAHDDKEIVGYLNKFETEDGDLVASGALVPFKDNDRATEIVHKSKAGVPYEASINFGGEGIKIQELGAGELAQVNGYEFEGPGMVIREWPLRGVAICPYGADMNTDSTVLADSNKQFTATVVTEPETTKERDIMADAPVENVAEVEQPEAVETELEQTEEAVEVDAAETSEEVVEAEEAEVEADENTDEPEAVELSEESKAEESDEVSRTELARISNDFGAEILAQVVKDGGDYQTALHLAYKAECEKSAALETALSEAKASKSGQPVPVAAAPEKPKSLFKTGK